MHILLLEPKRERAVKMKRSFKRMSYSVDHFLDAEAALTRLEREVSNYDVLLVNANLRHLSFLAWCDRMRKAGVTTPLIVFSDTRQALLPTVALLNDADDFVFLPVRAVELVARLQAVTRRARNSSVMIKRVGNVTLDIQRRVVSVDQVPITLRAKELLILEYLIRHSPEIVSRQKLLGYIWEVPDAVFHNTLDVHIKNLRRKLPAAAKCEIETVRGLGYRLLGSYSARNSTKNFTHQSDNVEQV